MTDFTPAFLPVYGSGPPGANVPPDVLYFDTSTTPYTSYVNNAGTWRTFGVAPGINATQLQGVNVSATAPTTNQKLVYNGTAWAPA